MKFTKTYECAKCGHSFPMPISTQFVTGATPPCPICRSNVSKATNKVVKSKKK